ncbi:uncharacterized protein LOC116656576 [Drosophila ananassae]|uniref:uncharacterized protein LOC116656576 n=1 Tax=Drosophila ananassae TaxID=7217 RepID=UPI0013A5C3D5|nr:uncharacterized protein LOC116656576 [Drosophila ananassae]
MKFFAVLVILSALVAIEAASTSSYTSAHGTGTGTSATTTTEAVTTPAVPPCGGPQGPCGSALSKPPCAGGPCGKKLYFFY